MKQFRKLAVELAQAAYSKKCRDIVILDVKKLTALCDYFIIATVNSQVQMKTVRESIDTCCSEKGMRPINSRSVSPSWQVLDYVGIVIHLMTPPTREFYRLERLWHRAKTVNWNDKKRTAKRTKKKTGSRKRA